jgi:hypothetical protein
MELVRLVVVVDAGTRIAQWRPGAPASVAPHRARVSGASRGTVSVQSAHGAVDVRPRNRAGPSHPVNARGPLHRLGMGLLGFWALYFAIVALSNLTDLLRSVNVLPAGWHWVSENLAFMTSATSKFGVPYWVNPILLAGVIAWQGLAAMLFWRSARSGGAALGPPFTVGVALWAVFILLDELLLIFETGAEATHLRLLIAQLLTLVFLRLEKLLEGAASRSPA